MDGRRWALVFAAALVGAVVLVAVWPPSSAQELESTAAIQETVPARKETTRPAAPEAPTPPIRSAESGDERFTRRAERVSQAIALLRYPASSQPLRPEMTDVLRPNRRHEAPLPLAFATGTGDRPRAGDPTFLFTGDVYSVVGSSALTATLEVFRESGGRRDRVAIEVTAAQVVLVDSAATRAITSDVLPNDEGRDGDVASGDRVYGIRVVPSTMRELAGYRGLARLEVDFVAREGDKKPAHASLDFHVASHAPATFTGVTSERLTPDGLELAVGVHVDEPGQYVVEGLLFDAKERPIGFAVARPTLGAGAANVPLLFWGLLFHEADAAGPYVFRTVTGYRLPTANEPDRADMAAFDGPYETRPYAVADFSDKEYESAAKDAKIKALSDLAARGSTKGR